MVRAVYPGTFDPFIRGHEDIVRRVAGLFDEVIVAVADSRAKTPCFSHDERLAMATVVLAPYPNVRVMGLAGLLCDFMQAQQARVIVRGVRGVADFEYEAQLAGMNRHLLPDLETLFLTPTPSCQFISGTLVREIALLGGDISPFVAPAVLACWQRKQAVGRV